MNMKSNILSRAAAFAAPALLAALCAVPAVNAAPEAPAKIDFKTAEKEFQKAGRNRQTPISEVSNTFARVLSATNLTAETRGRATIDFGNYHARRSLLEPALAVYEEAIAAKDAPPAIRVAALNAAGSALHDANFRGGYATYYHDDLDRAAAAYLRILDVQGATDMDKITALKHAARAMLDSKQEVVPEAEALFVKATKLPGLSEPDAVRAQLNLADYYIESLQAKKAMPVLAPLVVKAKEKKLHAHLCGAILESYSDALLQIDGFDKAFQMMSEGDGKGHYSNRSIANLCQRNGRPDLAVKFLHRDIPGPDKKPGSRIWYIETRLYGPYSELGVGPFCDFVEKDVLPILQENPDVWRDALGTLYKRKFGSNGGRQSAAYLSWLLSFAEKAPEGKGMAPADLLALATRCRDTDKALAAARAILEAGDPKAKGYQTAGLTKAVIEARDSKGAVSKVKAFLAKSDAKVRGEATLEAAQIAMALRHEKSARASTRPTRG